MKFVYNDLVISGYESDSDVLMYVVNAYSRCKFDGDNDLPPGIYEIEDNLHDEIFDSGISVFHFKGVPIGRLQVVDMLELILMAYQIEYIDSTDRHQNNAQNVMFREMLE